MLTRAPLDTARALDAGRENIGRTATVRGATEALVTAFVKVAEAEIAAILRREVVKSFLVTNGRLRVYL